MKDSKLILNSWYVNILHYYTCDKPYRDPLHLYQRKKKQSAEVHSFVINQLGLI